MNIKELVRAKNMDLMMESFNQEAKHVNNEGFIIKESPEVKKLRHKYDNLIARLDTDKNTRKQGIKYTYNIPLDSKGIIGLKGITKNLEVKKK